MVATERMVEREIHEITVAYGNNLRKAAAGLLALAGEYPDVGKIWLAIGLLYDRRGRESEAIPFYEKALSIGMSRDDQLNCLICLGSSLRNVGRLQDARSAFQRAAKSNPGCVAAQMFTALLMCDIGEHQGAVKLLAGLVLQADETQELNGFRSALTRKFKGLRQRKLPKATKLLRRKAAGAAPGQMIRENKTRLKDRNFGGSTHVIHRVGKATKPGTDKSFADASS